ncbi:twin-arginine translocase subunit TatB [Xanthomonas sp. XNM01]|nr:twin-arginine translocase subunit TatB [Xanthomonas sp. XNM01]
MFDIGFGELLLIAVVALVVLGPERLPKAARFAGLWVRRARAQWHSVRADLERELEAEELKRSLRETQESLKKAEAQLREEVGAAHDGLESIRRDVEKPVDAPPPAVESAVTPAADAGVATADSMGSTSTQQKQDHDESRGA